MKQCPYCQNNERQVKVGLNASGSQRYRCQGCGRKYTPQPKEHGYGEAVRLYVDGMNFRRIARQLGVIIRRSSIGLTPTAPSCRLRRCPTR